jgi:hypothetical protein
MSGVGNRTVACTESEFCYFYLPNQKPCELNQNAPEGSKKMQYCGQYYNRLLDLRSNGDKCLLSTIAVLISLMKDERGYENGRGQQGLSFFRVQSV